jgi:hypothetical protein
MAEQESAESIRPKMQVMLAVSHSIKGYPKPSLSSRNALDWILTKLIRPCCKKEYKILIFHVQIPDEDGMYVPLISQLILIHDVCCIY